jgi:hypothetical protein
MFSKIKTEHVLPIKLKFLISVTFFLAILGLLVGLPLVLFNLELPSMEGVEHDTKEHFELSIKYTMRFFGLVFTFSGITALIGSFLTHKKSRIGWFILVGLYSIGLIGCFYVFYRLFIFVIDFNLNLMLLVAAIPSPITGIIIWGIFGLFTLFHKQTTDYIFR